MLSKVFKYQWRDSQLSMQCADGIDPHLCVLVVERISNAVAGISDAAEVEAIIKDQASREGLRADVILPSPTGERVFTVGLWPLG